MCAPDTTPTIEASTLSLLPNFWQAANAAEPADPALVTESPPSTTGKLKQNIVTALQEERTDTPTKIQLLTFIEKDKLLLNKYLMEVTDKEPFVLTMLDLTRHTDDLLSAKAEALLADFDLAMYLSTLLETEPEHGESLVRRILSGRRDVDTAKLSQVDSLEQLLSDVERRPLVPTASRQGDRYYVRASWPTDASGAGIKKCLTAAFNEELITDRTLEKEAQVMEKLKGRRFVYWYSKEWAEYIARRIRKCGAEAFIHIWRHHVQLTRPDNYGLRTRPALSTDDRVESVVPQSVPQTSTGFRRNRPLSSRLDMRTLYGSHDHLEAHYPWWNPESLRGRREGRGRDRVHDSGGNNRRRA